MFPLNVVLGNKMRVMMPSVSSNHPMTIYVSHSDLYENILPKSELILKKWGLFQEYKEINVQSGYIQVTPM
jgi:hypothetical protein